MLYDQLDGRTYLRWLRNLGVRYVVLTDAPTDYSSKQEALLIRSGRSGLKPVFRGEHMTIYSVPKPQRIVTGSGLAELVELEQERMTVNLGSPGNYRIAVRYSPYWTTVDSTACVTKGDDGMMRLESPRQGRVTLQFKLKARRALNAMVGNRPDCVEPSIP